MAREAHRMTPRSGRPPPDRSRQLTADPFMLRCAPLSERSDPTPPRGCVPSGTHTRGVRPAPTTSAAPCGQSPQRRSVDIRSVPLRRSGGAPNSASAALQHGAQARPELHSIGAWSGAPNGARAELGRHPSGVEEAHVPEDGKWLCTKGWYETSPAQNGHNTAHKAEMQTTQRPHTTHFRAPERGTLWHGAPRRIRRLHSLACWGSKLHHGARDERVLESVVRRSNRAQTLPRTALRPVAELRRADSAAYTRCEAGRGLADRVFGS